MSDRVPSPIDRQIDPQDAPFNAQLADRRIDDPYQKGRFIIATASLRDDTLGRMYARKQISEHQYAAGRALQAAFEAVESSLKASKLEWSPRGGTGLTVAEHIMNAAQTLREARNYLGVRAFNLAKSVLLAGYGIEELAELDGITSSLGKKNLGANVRNMLDDAADMLGYRVRGPDRAKRR